MSSTSNYPLKKYLSVSLVVLLAIIGCSQALSSQTGSAVVASQPGLQTNTVANANSGYQIQVLKNCKLVKERLMTTEEVDLYLQLQQAEQLMEHLQVPLTQMDQELSARTKLLTSMSDRIEQQVEQYGEPEESLVREQAELSRDVSAIVDSFQPDITAVSTQGKLIGGIADKFTSLLKTDIGSQSYDQIRVISPGKQPTGSCDEGIFFQKSV
ncbi:MAG: hypothetical protein KJ930_15765 [Gammaproteobacteria bacterium]|nr:hypothetical protein [Gammaproteobacteria bacterium]